MTEEKNPVFAIEDVSFDSLLNELAKRVSACVVVIDAVGKKIGSESRVVFRKGSDFHVAGLMMFAGQAGGMLMNRYASQWARCGGGTADGSAGGFMQGEEND